MHSLRELTNLFENKKETVCGDLLGIVMHYNEYKLVGWKSEVILTISDGKNCLCDISFWRNHEDHKTCELSDQPYKYIKGKIVMIRRVKILALKESNKESITYDAVIENSLYQPRHLLVLKTPLSRVKAFLSENVRLQVDQNRSIIPAFIRGKTASMYFPNFPDEYRVTRDVLVSLIQYNYFYLYPPIHNSYFVRALTHYFDSLSETNFTIVQDYKQNAYEWQKLLTIESQVSTLCASFEQLKTVSDTQ